MNWLDTETKAILQKKPEEKLAPPKVGEFALVLLRKGTDHRRLVHAICRINNCAETKAEHLADLPAPVTINRGLTEGEALFGQFELICCDAISIFFRSEVLVLLGQDEGHRHALYQKFLASPEFQQTKVDVLEIPITEAGEKFAEQFLGFPFPGPKKDSDFSVFVPFKKARIMKHWADRIGARVRCNPFGMSWLTAALAGQPDRAK